MKQVTEISKVMNTLNNKVMKQRNYLALAALVTAATPFFFTACDKDDDCAPIQASINATILPMETRASNTEWTADDAIGVSADMGGEKYVNVRYRTDGSGKFSVVNDSSGVDNTIYYQGDATFDFTAYYPYAGANGTRPGTDGVIGRTITADDLKPEGLPGIDFLWAKAKGSSAAPVVNFSFDHAMSRLVFVFIKGDGVNQLEDIQYELDGLRPAGTFNTLTGVAVVDAGAQVQKLQGAVVAAAEMKAMLIGFPAQEGTLSLKVTMGGKVYNAQFLMAMEQGTNASIPLKGGCSYTYNVKMNKESITVERATITPWDEIPPQDVPATF